jgi:DNA-binding MarR family transcriptional regulator
MHELADRLLISRYNCTRLIDRMSEAGMVRRRAATDDRRGTEAVLTTEGRRAFRRAATTHLDGLARYVDRPLSTRSLNDIAHDLENIAAHVDTTDSE